MRKEFLLMPSKLFLQTLLKCRFGNEVEENTRLFKYRFGLLLVTMSRGDDHHVGLLSKECFDNMYPLCGLAGLVVRKHASTTSPT